MLTFGSTLNIIFSVLLFPVNLCCSFWIFNEALKLSGTTFKEMIHHLTNKIPTGSSNRYVMEKRKTIILNYLLETSPDQSKTRKLFHWYCYSTIPGFLALVLAGYTAYVSQNPNSLQISFIGNLLLLAVNIALVVIGKIYRNKNPLNIRTAEILHRKYKKEQEQKHKIRNTIVYSFVGALFFAVILFFFLGILGIMQKPKFVSNQSQTMISNTTDSCVADFYEVHTVLSQRGFETANIPTTYWSFDENKLVNVVSGIKNDTAFEFYEYSDAKTTDTVYEKIALDILNQSETSAINKKYETELEGGGKIFSFSQNGISYLTLYQGNTVVYTHSPEQSTEPQDILTELRYITPK